jgi:uncharacterized protein GlcG (DUF336 family)
VSGAASKIRSPTHDPQKAWSRTLKHLPIAAALLGAPLLLSSPASAQVNISGYTLPLALAVEAAEVAVKSCGEHGWPVNAFVVDTAGLVIVQLRGDHAVVHTKDSAFRKAYTVVTMGPIFSLDRTSDFVALVAKYPNGSGTQLASMPNVVALPGAVAIKHGSEIVAGLGVGGSPGGDKDEACASAGVAAIADRVK